MIKAFLNKLLCTNTKFYYWVQEFTELHKFKKSIRNNTAFSNESNTEKPTLKSLHKKYNQQNHKDYENLPELALLNGKLLTISSEDIRQEFIKYVFEEIDKLLIKKASPKILEIGCGSCANLVAINKEYGGALPLIGLDISQQRIEMAKNHYKEELEGIELIIADITKGVPAFKDHEFDMVFSMNCLEHITRKTEFTIEEMYRLASSKLLIIEPLYEFARAAERLNIINEGKSRRILQTVKGLGYKLSRLESLDIQSPPLKQSSIIVIDKE